MGCESYRCGSHTAVGELTAEVATRPGERERPRAGEESAR